jgi:hypothetical protein
MQVIEKILCAPCQLRNPSLSNHSGRTVAVTIGSGLRDLISRIIAEVHEISP